jgi:hypothetical protein
MHKSRTANNTAISPGTKYLLSPDTHSCMYSLRFALQEPCRTLLLWRFYKRVPWLCVRGRCGVYILYILRITAIPHPDPACLYRGAACFLQLGVSSAISSKISNAVSLQTVNFSYLVRLAQDIHPIWCEAGHIIGWWLFKQRSISPLKRIHRSGNLNCLGTGNDVIVYLLFF